ncbi:DUF3825 domain-containing protein [Actinosynnema sp. NPDC050801]|uniref:DUF3825 domain-containing protein n=1 Tax=unclassified Actinosynnema TaxID=2637065 RepID=UPI0033E98040
MRWWDSTKRYGLVEIEDTGETALANRTALPGTGYQCLVEGERVLVAISQVDGKGRVTTLAYPSGRIAGSVAEYDHLKGHGLITPDDSGEQAFVHFSDVLRPPGIRADLLVGERVTYELDKSPRPTARNVKRLDPRTGLDRFASVWPAAWQALADLVEHDVWTLNQPEDEVDQAQGGLPVLRSYIDYTFARLEEQGRLVDGQHPDGGRLGFNTGLVTPKQEEVYGVLAKQPDSSSGHAWRFWAWMKESDGRIAGVFSPRPRRATYWEDPSVLYYDTRLPLILDWDHFVEDNLFRYPADLRDESMALMLTKAAVERAVERVERNYKAAVPQFHRGQVQLLLPLALRGTAEAQLALVVRRVGDEYHGETVLPLAAALKNARLLARPDRDWLNP